LSKSELNQITEVEKPTPNENQVLIKVIAVSANTLDWHRMRGKPFRVRMGEGFLKPKNPKLGADIAGKAESQPMAPDRSLKPRCMDC